jgi:hypothetical protein
VVVTLNACATGPIPTASFQWLAASMQQIRTGADAAFGNVNDRMREHYVAGAGHDVDKVKGLLLKRPSDHPVGRIPPEAPLGGDDGAIGMGS